jgi:phosphonate transport system ATP-binding protein
MRAPEKMDEQFRLEKVDVSYREVAALRQVDLSIARGELVGLVGPSGSGKTTLLRCLNAMVTPSSGGVRILGVDAAGLGENKLRILRARIGFVAQDLGLVPNLRVVQNVVAGGFGRQGFFGALRSSMVPREREKQRVHAILQRVGIGEKIFARTDRLSGGQQQRVAVARALYQSPEAILADEPVSSVDPARARDTISLLTELAREEGMTLVMSLHNLELAREFFPRLIGLRGGRLVFDAPARALPDGAFDQLFSLTEEELLG